VTGKQSPSQIKRSIIIILALCVITRIVFFGFVHPWTPEKETNVVLKDDARGYHKLARMLIEQGRFAVNITDGPNAVRTPLYPLFIVAMYKVFGYKPWIVIVFQIMLDVLACLLLFLAVYRIFDRRVAFIASLFYALDPYLILYSSATLLSDSLFVFLIVAAFYCFSRAFNEEREKKALVYYGISSFFIGLGTLCKPISQFLPFVFVIFFFVWHRKHWKKALKLSILYLVIFGVTLSPWFIRNYRAFGRLAYSASSSENLLFGYVVPMEMIRRNKSFRAVKVALRTEVENMMRADGHRPQDLDDFQHGDYYRRLGIKYIQSDPVLFGKTYVFGIMHTFTNLSTIIIAEKLEIPMPRVNIKASHNIFGLVKDYIKRKGLAGFIIAIIIVPFLIVTYMGAVVGLIVSWKRYDKYILFLCVFIIVYFVVLTGVEGDARFKMPAIPFYLIFTGIGLAYLIDKLKRRRFQ